MATRAPAPAKTAASPATAARDGPASKSFAKDDFPLIRKATITLGACLLLAGALVSGSEFFLSKQEARKLQALSELTQAQGKYTAISDEKNDIRNFQAQYVALAQRGFVGEEKRLDVIEQIHAIQDSRKLLAITYEIFPQQVVAVDPALLSGELDLRASKLTVRMSLLHELDLITFLGDLSRQGIFSPQQCSMKGRDAGSTIQRTLLPPPLEAECTLYWITMARRAPADGSASPPQ